VAGPRRGAVVAFGRARPGRNGPSTDNLDNIIVGDFNGDGYADVGHQYVVIDGGTSTIFMHFEVSLNGRGNFNDVRVGLFTDQVVDAGRFEGGSRADLLSWKDFDFLVAPAIVGATPTLSRQDMR
jgi:hypothetical protein